MVKTHCFLSRDVNEKIIGFSIQILINFMRYSSAPRQSGERQRCGGSAAIPYGCHCQSWWGLDSQASGIAVFGTQG